MKILFITPNPVFGGAATATISIASLLKKSGIDVIYNDEYDNNNKRENIEVDHYPFHAKKYSGHKEVRNHICSIRPDLIVWSPQCSIYYYCDIKKLKKIGIKQVCVIHSLSLKQNLTGKIIDIFISKVIKKLDATVFVSKYTLLSWGKYASVKNCSGEKKVIYNAVDAPQLIYERNKPLKVGFVGRFSAEKQPDLFCSVADVFPGEYKFHAWGEGELLEGCKERYPKVVFHGQENDINNIYKNIDILLLTSKFENCPMVILEAKVRGIPCVAPNVGGIPEIVNNEEDGVLYSTFDRENIKEALLRIINNYSSFSLNCKKNSVAYSYDNVAKSWIDLFTRIQKNNK